MTTQNKYMSIRLHMLVCSYSGPWILRPLGSKITCLIRLLYECTNGFYIHFSLFWKITCHSQSKTTLFGSSTYKNTCLERPLSLYGL